MIIAAPFDLSNEAFICNHGIGSFTDGFKHALGERVFHRLGARLVDQAFLLPDKRRNELNILPSERQKFITGKIQENPIGL